MKESGTRAIGDVARKLLGMERKRISLPKPADYTSFQTPTGYQADNDIKTDIAIVYSQEAERFESWRQNGYRAHCMWGPRAGKEFCEGITNGRPNWDEIQTTRDGKPFAHSPGAWYGAPGPLFTAMARDYFLKAIDAGAEAIIPEEPEYFSQSGYSRYFKDEWQRFYGRPWEDQVSSVQARYDSSRLKAELEKRLIAECFRAAKEKKPTVKCIVAEHSPVNYGAWGIVCPHYGLMQLPTLDGIIGQVWTGTARTPTRYQGRAQERTFENAYLEYSSLYNLLRGTGKRLWFLMDPVEDHPGRSMDDYHINYEQTLLASLLFPEVNSYEVMPWPTRIFGRVPPHFATEITTIVSALNDMHAQKGARWDAGTPGIATFVSDTIMWQRGEPSSSNFDGFYGITLPLLMNGVPVQVAQLERAGEKNYLKPYKLIFLSYDAMKPTSPAIHEGLARWVHGGGTLIFLGGNDRYNDVREWWKEKGFATPQEDLFSRMGIRTEAISPELTSPSVHYTTAMEEKNPIRDLQNRQVYTLDLAPFLKDNPSRTVYVRFSDAQGQDGWGAWLADTKLVVDDRVVAEFHADTPEEQACLADDNGTGISGQARFADLTCYWVYRFVVPKGDNAVLKLDMANQFRVSISTEAQDATRSLLKGSNAVQLPEPKLLRPFYPIEYRTEAEPLFRTSDTSGIPAFSANYGKGHFLFMGIPASYYASSSEGAQMLRELTRYGLSLQGESYAERRHLALKRGRYFIARCFDETLAVPGRWVNLLDPSLPVQIDPVVPANGWALYYDAGKPAARPRLLYASSRVEAKNETDQFTAFLISGPSGTPAAARIETAGRKISSAKVYDLDGNSLVARFASQKGTLLAQFANRPQGAVVRVEWEPAATGS